MAAYLSQFQPAQALERFLGNPLDNRNLLSFPYSSEQDEQEVYPEAAHRLLDDWQLHEYYIPSQYQGKLRSYEELLLLLRTVARRDLTLAIGHSATCLGAIAIWNSGTDAQKRQIAALIRNNAQLSLSLTEKEHGSDLLACETTAVKVADGYQISGVKWLINNATRSKAITLFTRTDRSGDPRGFSLFLVDKTKLERERYAHLAKVKTLGIRGADISGIRFEHCFVEDAALIGPVGAGLEITLKALQISRTLCAGLSLGAAQAALLTTLRFAFSRTLYGDSLLALPYVRQILVDSFLDILICDCVAMAAARGLHVATEQFSVWSSIVKYFVPVTVEKVIHSLSLVLGARFYLREEHDHGIFAKMMRDNALVSLFDGSVPVNLYSIILQARFLAERSLKRAANNPIHPTAEDQALEARLNNIFALDQQVVTLQPERLALFAYGHDDVLQGLSLTIIELHKLRNHTSARNEVLEQIIVLAEAVAGQAQQLQRSLLSLTKRARQAFHKLPAAYQLAEQYCALHAAAACIHLWYYNLPLLGDFFREGKWLAAALYRLLRPSPPLEEAVLEPCVAAVAEELTNRYLGQQQFFIVPLALATH